ncbi:lipase family protein [Gilvimarinus sp. F26214L]|uniref:lipase family protein n=1 Tax=Gilvimarinus sp. DZF01 TaxID=3461371 RepID=UPI00404560E3
MTKELSPFDAARLALGIYDVNSGNNRQFRAFLADPIFSPGPKGQKVMKTRVGGHVLRAAKDGFGLCATGGGLHKGDVFLIFRGTTTANNKADFVTDARIGLERGKSGWPVHIGFNHAFTAMLPEIRKSLEEFNCTGTVHCLGHSLGGAVATLAADWAIRNQKRPVKLYTFGQPRVGLSMFSLMLTTKLGAQNIHRVFHTTDPVPMVPIYPYVHNPMPGFGLRVMSENPILSGEAHRMKYYADQLERKRWSDLTSAPPLHTHESMIKAWLESKTPHNPASTKTFEWLENALVWLVTKQLSALAHGIQWVGMGIHTFVDKVAWLLARGVEVGENCADYVKLFMRKVTQVLGIPVASGANLTRDFFRFLLETLTRRANDLAMKAIRGLRSGR